MQSRESGTAPIFYVVGEIRNNNAKTGADQRRDGADGPRPRSGEPMHPEPADACKMIARSLFQSGLRRGLSGSGRFTKAKVPATPRPGGGHSLQVD